MTKDERKASVDAILREHAIAIQSAASFNQTVVAHAKARRDLLELIERECGNVAPDEA